MKKAIIIILTAIVFLSFASTIVSMFYGFFFFDKTVAELIARQGNGLISPDISLSQFEQTVSHYTISLTIVFIISFIVFALSVFMLVLYIAESRKQKRIAQLQAELDELKKDD